jgi:hypothetical protein
MMTIESITDWMEFHGKDWHLKEVVDTQIVMTKQNIVDVYITYDKVFNRIHATIESNGSIYTKDFSNTVSCLKWIDFMAARALEYEESKIPVIPMLIVS